MSDPRVQGARIVHAAVSSAGRKDQIDGNQERAGILATQDPGHLKEGRPDPHRECSPGEQAGQQVDRRKAASRDGPRRLGPESKPNLIVGKTSTDRGQCVAADQPHRGGLYHARCTFSAQ